MSDARRYHTTLAKSLFVCVRASQMYAPKNESLKKPLNEFVKNCQLILDAEGSLNLEVVDRDFFINGHIVRTDLYTFSSFQALVSLIKERGLGGFSVDSLPEARDIYVFAQLLGKALKGDRKPTFEEFAQKSPERIRPLPYVEKRSITQNIDDSVKSKKKRALGQYISAVGVLHSAKQTPKKGIHTKMMLDAKRSVYDLVDLCMDEGFSFFGLSNIKQYDEYTFNHSINVCVISISFGKNLGLKKKQIAELGLAAMFHDFGKIEIPIEILNKPGSFDESEWKIMKQHPVQSVKCFLQGKDFHIQDLKKMIAAYEHHRNYDCSGYPNTGLNKPMNFYSRVIAIADAYDAMTTNRVYQRAMLATDALQILKENAGTKFDPTLVKAFINTVGIFPVGSLAILNRDFLGVISEVPKNPKQITQPKVKLVGKTDGTRYDQAKEIDLLHDSEYQIERCVSPDDYDLNIPYYLFGEILEEN